MNILADSQPTEAMHKQTLQTPGQRLAQALAGQVTEERLAAAISGALTATQANRDGTITPDHKTRLASTQLALSYLLGKPVERQEVVTVNLDADNSLGIEERLQGSPALRDALRKMLAECDDSPVIETEDKT